MIYVKENVFFFFLYQIKTKNKKNHLLLLPHLIAPLNTNKHFERLYHYYDEGYASKRFVKYKKISKFDFEDGNTEPPNVSKTSNVLRTVVVNVRNV